MATNEARAQGPPPADAAGLQRATFTLEDTRYQMLLPQRASLTPPSGQVDSVIIRDLSRSTRLERLLILRPAQRENDRRYAVSVKLKPGAVLRYTTQDNIGGGSGGPIAELIGHLQLGTRALAVTCTDQSEHLRREPDWCVAYLHHLEIDGPR